MKETSDQVRAQRLMSVRDLGPYGFSTFVKLNAKPYLFRITFNAVGLAIIAFTGMWACFALLLGTVIGFLRDVSWVRSTNRMWPFTMKVTNWDMVEQLAKAELPPDPLFPQDGRQ